MAQRISRRKIAEFVASEIVGGKKTTIVLREVAAFLIESRRTRELDLIVRDIEAALMDKGVVIADVTSAFALTDELKKHIATLVGGKQLILREEVDPSVLGGLRITIPGQQLDATLKRKIDALKA